MTYAALTPVPENKKVMRILDTGTGIGQYATSIKRRFPDAEVWGIDIGAPMLRYAHMRAVDMGVPVNFRQALSEKTGFPDNHFDLVISHLLHHEVTIDLARALVRGALLGQEFHPELLHRIISQVLTRELTHVFAIRGGTN